MNPDLSRGFDFALLQQGEIYLRGGNMFVRQHPAHRVNVRSAGKLQDGIRMPEAMKGNVFGDTSSRDPAFERPQQHIAGQTRENRSIATRPHKTHGIIAERQGRNGIRFFRLDLHAIASARETGNDIRPLQRRHIAVPQTRKA